MLKFFFCFLLLFSLQAKTVCLNMIVKDEAEVIERCLNSVKSLIDYWVIVDTGSTDGTQEIVKKCMEGIPGELYEREWVNFAQNRNEALELAKEKADYLLIIDADEALEYGADFVLPSLERDCYEMVVRQEGAVDFRRIALISTRLGWKWEGVLHESLVCPETKTSAVLENVMNHCDALSGSGRSKLSMKEKYLRDAKALEEALKKEPNNSRYVHYLGQSYLAAGELELALKNYKKRVEMPSADFQETFLALYSIGIIQEKLKDYEAAIESYFKANRFYPTRAEPLFRAAVVYRGIGNYLLGYLLSKYALTLPYPKNDLCVEYKTYDHALLIEFANCALLLDKNEEGLEACSQLLKNPNLPEELREPVSLNYELAKSRIGK